MERPWEVDIRSPSQQSAQVVFQAGQAEVGHPHAWLDLREDVDVVGGPEVVAEDGAEEGEPSDSVSSTQRRQLTLWHFDP